MKLVEIIPGLATTDNIVQTTKELATSMGKTTTVVQDVPGFVANRLLMPYINEAVILLENVGYGAGGFFFYTLPATVD
jgi:3-hydroxybutyryl-CoA dehydrogenase